MKAPCGPWAEELEGAGVGGFKGVVGGGWESGRLQAPGWCRIGAADGLQSLKGRAEGGSVLGEAEDWGWRGGKPCREDCGVLGGGCVCP